MTALLACGWLSACSGLGMRVPDAAQEAVDAAGGTATVGDIADTPAPGLDTADAPVLGVDTRMMDTVQVDTGAVDVVAKVYPTSCDDIGTEPVIPPACATVLATKLVVPGDATTDSDENALDTRTIQAFAVSLAGLAPAEGGAARQLTHLKGLLGEPKWSPDGKRIAILFTENLPHAAGPLDPVPAESGVLEVLAPTL